MGYRNFHAVFKRISTTITDTSSNFNPKPGKPYPYSRTTFLYSPV